MSLRPLLQALHCCKIKHIFFYKQKAGIHPTPSRIPPDSQLIELVTSGQGAVETSGGWVPVKGGDLIWHLPGDYTIGQSHFDDPYRCLVISLVGTPPNPPPPRITACFTPSDAFNFMLETTQAYRDEAFDRDLLLSYSIGKILFHIQAAQQTAEIPPSVARALAWIRTHFATPCPIEKIAEEAGCSVSHLHYLFQKHLEVSPHQAIIRERIKAARIHLVSTHHPLKQIASDCGFSDAPAFTRLFKAHTGMTPGAYRNRYQGIAGPLSG